MAARINLVVPEGATFVKLFPVTNPDGTRFDLLGYTPRCEIRSEKSRTAPLIATPACTVPNEGVLVPDSGDATLTFAAATKTVVRTAGSWTADGFLAAQRVTFASTVSNNSVFTVVSVSALTMTLLEAPTDEVIASGATAVALSANVRAELTRTITLAMAGRDGWYDVLAEPADPDDTIRVAQGLVHLDTGTTA